MSLAKRLFGKFIAKKEQPAAAPPPEADEGSRKVVRPPAPRTSSAAPPVRVPEGGSVVPIAGKDRSASQTFQISAPKVKLPAEAAAPAAPEGGVRRRVVSLKTGPGAEPPAEGAAAPSEGAPPPAAADPLRRSQTIRVSPPVPVESGSRTAEAAEPSLHAAAETLDSDSTIASSVRHSQTIRVSQQAVAAGAPAEAAPEAKAAPEGPPAATPPVARADQVLLPAGVVLKSWPEPLRGPMWRTDTEPGGWVLLDKSLLLRQLQSGRVVVQARDVAGQLPRGWSAPEPEGEVELDLARVVEAMPAEMLRGAEEEDQDVAAAEALGTLFRKAGEAEPPPKAVREAPPAAAAGMPPAAAPAPAKQAEEADDEVELPANILIHSLPPEMRGPAWRSEGTPGVSMRVDRASLLKQLAKGRVVVDAIDIGLQLPDGWVAENAEGDILLDLASVVAAIPEGLMQADGEMLQEVVESAGLGQLFTPHGAEKPEAAEPAAETAPPPARVRLPFRAVLSMLPEALRGPAWRSGAFPEGSFEMPQDAVVEQLAKGEVSVDVAEIAAAIPDGWIASDVTGALPLDLSEVVRAIPDALLTVEGDMAEDVVAAESLGVLFSAEGPAAAGPVAVEAAAQPAAPAAEEQPPLEPEGEAVAPPLPAPAGAAAPGPASPALRSKLEQPFLLEEVEAAAEEEVEVGAAVGPEGEWDGVEPSMEMAPLGVNINLAGRAQLMQLRSVGEVRAGEIVAYRDAHGPFRSIYDLAGIPGIGPASFRLMTGFPFHSRANRHAILEGLLDLTDDGSPLLARVVRGMRAEFGATGCLLTSREGIPLAVDGDMPEATKYAALGSRYFFRTRRHLQRFVEHASDCIILPGSKPPLLLLSRDDTVVIITLSGSTVSQRRLDRMRRAMREIAWLLSRRAVVVGL
ncbi:MAG: helix-hairpin-helix domain-containing protein [Lentisphaeria bacterium]|nr:helix-hairpin-helix domain-containing protein [Lentisphaeria bacterium]